MTQEHPNVALMKGLDIRNLAGCAHLFAPDFVWHYINPNLPEIEGDYVGWAGLQSFFEAMGSKTNGSFHVRPISVAAFGDELVVTHVRNSWIGELWNAISYRNCLRLFPTFSEHSGESGIGEAAQERCRDRHFVLIGGVKT